VAGATYAWTGPNGFSSALQNPSITTATVGDSGAYNVTVTVNGCSSVAGTTLATNTTNAHLSFRFNGTQYVAITPVT